MALQTATNPKTGESVVLINNQWLPISQTATNPKTGERAYLVNNQWVVDRSTSDLIGRPPVVEEESVFRQVADVPVGIARSFVGGLENVANTYRPDSDAAKSLRGAKEYLGALMSATAKKDEKEQARILKEVEDKGAMDQVQGALKALAVAPVDTVASAVGSLGVQAIGALTGFLLGGPPGALIGSRVVGGAMGAGGTKGAIYSEVKKALKENGVPEDRAEKLAIEAQEYGGKNLDMIALSGGLGIFAGGTGAEKDLIKKIVSRTVAKEAAESAAKQAVTEVPKTGAKAAAKTVIKSAGAEGVPEVLQAAQEKAAENIALQRTGEELGIKALAETPTMRGVFAAGTMEGIAGAVVGGGLSLRQAVRIARDSGASDEQIKQLQDRIDAEQAKKELQIQAAAVSPEAVAGRASELVGEAPSAADVLTAAQQAVSEKLDEPPAAPETPAQKVAEASAEVDAMTSRVDELTNEYIAAGVEPDKAKIQAAAQVAEEEKNDREVEQAQAELSKVQAEAAKGAEDVAKTIEQAGGESVPIPSEPAGAVPAGGVEPPVTERVERPAPAAEEPVRREEAPSGAVEEKPKTKTETKPFIVPPDFYYTVTESPAYENLAPLSFEDAAFELEVLQERANRGKLTPEQFAQSEIGQRINTAQIAPINESLRVDPVGTIAALQDNFNQKQQAKIKETESKKEPPSATTPTETIQAKEERAAAPVEGTEVAEFATAAKPVTVTKQPSRKNEAGENVKDLILSTGETVSITRKGNQWTQSVDGVDKPIGKTLKDAIAVVTGQAAAPEVKPGAKRGPKPKLTPEERENRAVESGMRTEELNAVENIILSTKKLKGTDSPGLATMLDLYLGPRPETSGKMQQYHDTFMKGIEGQVAKIGDPAAKTEALNDYVSRAVTPALEELHRIGTDPRYKGTRIEKLAMDNFERGPANIKKGIIARAERKQEAAKPVEPAVSEEPVVTPKAPTGPAPTVTVKKKRVIQKPAEDEAAPSKQPRESGPTSQDAKPNFGVANLKKSTAKRAAGAVIADTKPGSFFNVLATRLRNALGNIPFVVVDANDPDVKLRKAFEATQAKGIYIPPGSKDLLGNEVQDGIIYVAGAKYGRDQGINNVTVAHELLHAGTREKIEQGKQIDAKDPNSTDPRAVAYRRLRDLMAAARQKYDALVDTKDEDSPFLSLSFVKKVSQQKPDNNNGNALYDVNEFLTYGMTDPVFRDFLKQVPFGKTRTVFSEFVAAIRKLLGLNKNDESALANLIEVTDDILSIEPSSDIAIETVETLSQKRDVKNAAQVQVKYANNVIRTPRNQGPNVSLLDQAIANGMDVSSQAELAGAVIEGGMSEARKHLIGALTPSQIAKLVKDKVPALTRVVDAGRKFNAKRQQLLDELKGVMKPWLKLQRNDREQSQLLATIMHLATVNGIDPSIPASQRLASTPQSDTLDDLWEKLDEPARKIYVDVRDYYAKQYEQYKDLLKKRIEAMGISDEEKTKFMDLLKKEFETDKVASPYFPLMRYGENWLRVGSGKNMEFYMFESASERNRFAIRRAKEMGKPAKALYDDQTFQRGDELSGLVNEAFADTTKLKEVLAAVDKLGIDTDKAAVKDEIYQMYLLTLPEKSFRKQFIHRKNTAGYSADALRNLGVSGFRMSNQLAKLEFQPQITNGLSEARDSIKDDPDSAKYRTYIEEVADDFDAVVNVKNENSILNFVANGLSTFNFYYYMSSISSALTNMTSLPVFGYPTLLAEYGTTPGGAKAVHKELLRFMNVYKEFGYRRKVNGQTEYVLPSVRNALTDPDEIKAYDEFAADNLFTFNRSMDLLNVVQSPSEQATNPNIVKRVVQVPADAISKLFSFTEQLPREMMAMTAYRIGRQQGLSHQNATKKALDLTHDAMYDYSLFDTPRYFRGPVGRTLFQFKKFSQNTAFYLATNGINIIKHWKDPALRNQAVIKLFGTLGMTGMFAGVTGFPLYTVITTVVEKVLGAYGDDDDDEDSAIFMIRKYGFDLWFKKYLSENFGANIATYVALGPVTGLTGADFNARVKLNDLFFPDWEFKGLLGPSFGLYENAQRAYDRFREGQTERAIETMLPSFIRQPVKAYRFSEEGVKTPRGFEVVSKEDLNWMDIAMQSAGFAPVKVSAKQTENYKLKKLEQEREEERTDLLKRAVYARRGISDEDFDDVMEDIQKYNKKFPNRRILPNNIIQSDQARRRQERVVDQGLYIANPMTRRELQELRAKE